ncbi:Proline dipeptidase [Mycoplasma yeatsii 13926]|uniref:Proline dipeptidase n=1 Tax=Mycoplasma yeatsii 13926 TaxID=1188240 RepID=S6G6Y1_9MOLU|nr:YigZ family protein [Mycoplasma yeatsii]EOA07313.1 Proline dipeptidase [Mycoplasma yeatsii 13926]
MKTIDSKVYTNQIIIKNSKFITIMTKVNSKQDLESFLDKYRQLDATHNCYAYRIYDDKVIGGYNDDGEPSSTAGKPIFNVLEKNNLFNVVILVIRYYGGIKLGAGPLTRAYSNCASEIVKLADIIETKKYYVYKIQFNITEIKQVNNWINKNKIEIINKEFNENVVYLIQSEDEIDNSNLFEILEKSVVNK